MPDRFVRETYSRRRRDGKEVTRPVVHDTLNGKLYPFSDTATAEEAARKANANPSTIEVFTYFEGP